MPVYLAHGFKWPRDGLTGIRGHCVVNNLDDIACDYLQSEQSATTLLQSFREHFPNQMQKLEDARTGRTLYFLEQYDPDDEISENAVSQPYCFIADRVIPVAAGNTPVYPCIKELGAPENKHDKLRVPSGYRPKSAPAPSSHASGRQTSAPRTPAGSSPLLPHNPATLSLNVEEAMSNGPAVTPQAWEAMAELRDQIAEGEKIGWWIVYNGDPDRAFPPDDDLDEADSEYDDESDERTRTPTQSEPFPRTLLGQPVPSLLPPDLKGLGIVDSDRTGIGIPVPYPPPLPPPPLERPPPPPGETTPTRPKSSRSFTSALRKRSSKGNLRPPKNEPVPDLPKLKEMSKREGFRARFFGRASDKR